MPDLTQIEPHERPRESCLVPHLDLIADMRKKHWPYRKILAHLEEQENLIVVYNTLRSFCKVRQIEKGVGIKEEWKPSPTPPSSPQLNVDAMIDEASEEVRKRANQDPFRSPVRKK